MGTAQECNKHKLGSNPLGEQILYIPLKPYSIIIKDCVDSVCVKSLFQEIFMSTQTQVDVN
jgi:hypothetical protein